MGRRGKAMPPGGGPYIFGSAGPKDLGGFDASFVEQMRKFFNLMSGGAGGGGGPGGFRGSKVVLDERNFRRVDRFEGDSHKFRGWIFDLTVALGQVDHELSRQLEGMIKRCPEKVKVEDWKAELDPELDLKIYEKYSGELYGVLVGLTAGEAKSIVKGISDSGRGQDGFAAYLALHRRYDVRTQASLLQAYLEVVNPGGIKGIGDMVAAIHKWESKVAVLKMRHGEDIGGGSGELKKAIFVGMLPKDYQDMIMQNQSMMDHKPTYQVMRDYILGVVTQKLQFLKPTPMDIGEVWGESTEGSSGGGKWSEGGGTVDGDWNIEALSDTKCYRCGGYGHFARECATKGKRQGERGSEGKGERIRSQGRRKGAGQGRIQGIQGKRQREPKRGEFQGSVEF